MCHTQADRMNRLTRSTLAFAALLLAGLTVWAQPLPSWSEGHARARTLAFVQAVTDKPGKDFVEPAEPMPSNDQHVAETHDATS
jgi:hypothetical protein